MVKIVVKDAQGVVVEEKTMTVEKVQEDLTRAHLHIFAKEVGEGRPVEMKVAGLVVSYLPQ